MERLLVQTLLSGNWCPSKLSIRTTSVFTIQFTRLCNHSWILLPLLMLMTPNSSSLFPPSFSNTHIVTRNVGIILDDRLSFTPSITAVARSCRFALYNIRIWSFLTKDAMQLLVQALVMDHCNSLLAGLSASATKLLQHIQNSAARLVYNLPKASRPSTDMHQFTSKHWSNHTPQQEHFAHLHQLAGWYRNH